MQRMTPRPESSAALVFEAINCSHECQLLINHSFNIPVVSFPQCSIPE